MEAKEIIRTHAANQGQNPNALAANIKKFLDQPGAKAVRGGDCIFLFRAQNKTANFYVLNGGSSVGYLRALREFAALLRKVGCKKAAMRVQDKVQSKKIAQSAGVASVEYTEVGGKTDPYLMTMEL